MPTTVFRNTAEAIGGNGTAVTQGAAGNSASPDYFDTVFLGTPAGALTVQTAAKKHGTYGLRFLRAGASTAQIYVQKVFASDITNFVGQHWCQINALPSVNTVLFKGYTDSAATITSWAVAMNTTGRLLLLGGSGSSTISTSATTDTMPAGADIRFEYEVVPGTSIRVVAFAGDSNTVYVDSGVQATALVGVTRAYRNGLLTTGAAPAQVDIDDIRLGSGPGFFGLSTTATPSSLVSNPGGFTAVGAASLDAALANVESNEAAPTSYVESVAGPAGAQFTVGFEATILPNGTLSIERWDSQDIASPIIDSTLDIIVGGAVVGTNTVALSTTPTKTTFTTGVVTGDMSTLRGRYTDTSR